MAHTLIVGTTASGKSVLARALAEKRLALGGAVIVFDPVWNPKEKNAWGKGAVIYREPQPFIDAVWKSSNCLVIADEAGEHIRSNNSPFVALATRGRHNGHDVIFIAQRIKMLLPTVRDNVDLLFLFATRSEDAQYLAGDWNDEDLWNAVDLPPRHFITKRRLQPCEPVRTLSLEKKKQSSPRRKSMRFWNR